MINQDLWKLNLPQPTRLSRKSFFPILYLIFFKRFGVNTLVLPRSLLWSQLYLVETQRVDLFKKKLFSRSRVPRKVELRYTKQEKSARISVSEPIHVFSQRDLWYTFLQTWSLDRPKGNIHYTAERDFRLFFLALAKSSVPSALVNPRGYYSRWVNSYNFLFNLFFVNSFAQVLSSRFFVEESLVFNWQYSYKNYKLYKFVQPFILFSDTSHGEFIHDVVAKLLQQNLDFLIIVDLRSHDKLLKYLKRYNVFMVGLTPINYSPWAVSYPIPTFADSYLNQYYFLRFILRLQTLAQMESYVLRFNNPYLTILR